MTLRRDTLVGACVGKHSGRLCGRCCH